MLSTAVRARQQSRHLPAFVLLLIAEAPTHGGALQSALAARLPSLRADSAAVYRTLKQLEKDGDVVAEWDTTGAGPPIRVYRVTPQGRESLERWRADVEDRLANLRAFLDAHDALRRRRA
jgi:DNA-binding PadR family transcriptional regulator